MRAQRQLFPALKGKAQHLSWLHTQDIHIGMLLIKIGNIVRHPPVFGCELHDVLFSVLIKIEYRENTAHDQIFVFCLIALLDQVLIFWRSEDNPKFRI